MNKVNRKEQKEASQKPPPPEPKMTLNDKINYLKRETDAMRIILRYMSAEVIALRKGQPRVPNSPLMEEELSEWEVLLKLNIEATQKAYAEQQALKVAQAAAPVGVPAEIPSETSAAEENPEIEEQVTKPETS